MVTATTNRSDMEDMNLAQILGELVPVKELGEPNLDRLAEAAETQTLSPGDKLTSNNETTWLVYLLEGKLGLASMGRAAGGLEAGTPRAKLPVFSDRANNDFAVAEGSATILRVDKALFGKLLNDEHLSGYQVVSDLEVSDQESALFQEIYAAYQEKKLELPPMPEVALRIRRMADDPDVGIPELAKVVQMDAAVAGAVMHAANSPLFMGAQPVSSIRDAVVRLGLKTTHNLATSIAMRQTFQLKSSLVKERVQSLWERSVNVSALSYVIAKRQGRPFDPDRALLAGLLHEIGTVPILSYVEKHKLQPAPEELDHIIAKLNSMIGVLILSYWGLDGDLITVVEEAQNWSRDPAPEPDYADIVLVARAYNGAYEPCSQCPPLTELPALKKLNLGELDDEGRPEVLREAEAEVTGVRQILNA